MSRFQRAVTMGYTIKAFHGTTEDIEKFEVQGADLGMHFGTNDQAWVRITDKAPWNLNDPEEDLAYDAVIMPVLLRITNPLEMEDVGDWADISRVVMELNFSKDFLNGLTEKNRNKFDRLYGKKDKLPMNDATIMAEVRKLIQSAGFDGVVYRNKYEGSGYKKSYIVFKSNQVKSLFAKFEKRSGLSEDS